MAAKKKPVAEKSPDCPACAELGDRFHFSFPEDQSAAHPAAFAHLDNVAHSVSSFRDELKRCDVCQTYFAWNRMWDNDVYSTPLDYVDVYRLTDKEADDWLKFEKDWVRKERAYERRQTRKLEKLWADKLPELSAAERTVFSFLAQLPSKGQAGEKIEKECGLSPDAMWQALESLQEKKIVSKTLNTMNWPREHADYEVSRWRHS